MVELMGPTNGPEFEAGKAQKVDLFSLFTSQGSVAFSEETGDRIAWTKIEQLQRGKYKVVAFYDQKTDNLTWLPPESLPTTTTTSTTTSSPSSSTPVEVFTPSEDSTIEASIQGVITDPMEDLGGDKLVTTLTTTVSLETTTKSGVTREKTNRVIWLGKKIPQDRTIVRPELRKLNLWLYLSMVILSFIGVIFAILLIYFNFKYAHRR